MWASETICLYFTPFDKKQIRLSNNLFLQNRQQVVEFGGLFSGVGCPHYIFRLYTYCSNLWQNTLQPLVSIQALIFDPIQLFVIQAAQAPQWLSVLNRPKSCSFIVHVCTVQPALSEHVRRVKGLCPDNRDENLRSRSAGRNVTWTLQVTGRNGPVEWETVAGGQGRAENQRVPGQAEITAEQPQVR